MIFRNKKIWLIFSIIFLVIISIKISGLLNSYNETSENMRPEFQSNSTIFATNFGDYDRGDILLVKYKESFQEENLSFLRLIGKPGDTILVDNNLVYVNGKKSDKNRELSFQYNVSFYIYNQIKNAPEFITTPIYGRIYPSDTLRVFMEENFANKRNLNSKKLKRSKDEIDEFIKEQYGEQWNAHFFGPLIIPPDKFFLLGDNRDNTWDSRYIGLTDKKDILAKALFNFNF